MGGNDFDFKWLAICARRAILDPSLRWDDVGIWQNSVIPAQAGIQTLYATTICR
jgi:hypothetical protein